MKVPKGWLHDFGSTPGPFYKILDVSDTNGELLYSPTQRVANEVKPGPLAKGKFPGDKAAAFYFLFTRR